MGNWPDNTLALVVATSLTDDTPKTIDFSTTVGHGKHAPKVGTRDDTNCYFLPKKFNKNDQSFREDNIHGIFVRLCHAAGFTVHAEYTELRKASDLVVSKGDFIMKNRIKRI